MATGQSSAARELVLRWGTLFVRYSTLALHELVPSQAEKGQGAINDTHRIVAGSSLDTIVLTALFLSVVGELLILGLLQKSPRLKHTLQPFHLN